MSEKKFIELPDSVVDSVFDKVVGVKDIKKNLNFDYEKKMVRNVFDKCIAPPSVGDWECNDYIVDSAGYVPLDKMIKRMIEDGERLEEYRLSADYQAMFEKYDEQIPVDDFMYQDRAELLLSARELQAELNSIRVEHAKAEQSTKVDTSPVKEETVSTAEKTE